jgi:DNA-binding transcriptional ArsR family regulator
MSNDDFTPVPTMTLADDQRIRSFVHPTRMTILELLATEKRSVSGVARLLGVHPANLTHHFKLLEKTGLIRLVEKRDTGRNLEKYYRAVAYHFVVDPAGGPLADKRALALSILRDNLAVAIRTLPSSGDDRGVLAVLSTLRLTPADFAELQARLERLLSEFAARQSDAGAPYCLNVSCYPGEVERAPTQDVVLRV